MPIYLVEMKIGYERFGLGSNISQSAATSETEKVDQGTVLTMPVLRRLILSEII
jgi:hypothetical protein